MKPHPDDRLLDGRGGLLAVRRPLHRPVGGGLAGRGVRRDEGVPQVFQNEQVGAPVVRAGLWHWYDCTDYAANLYNLPTIAYAGELDTQKQASDIMMKAMEAEGLKLERIIGPKTKHAYEKNAKVELDKRLDESWPKAAILPGHIRFTTWTLRYNHMFWLTVDGMEHHWQRARVDADRVARPGGIAVTTTNVTAITLRYIKPLKTVTLDGTEVTIPANAQEQPQVLLTGSTEPEAPEGLRSLPAVGVLRRVWARHFVREGGANPGGGARLRGKDEPPPPATEPVESPYDTEARLPHPLGHVLDRLHRPHDPNAIDHPPAKDPRAPAAGCAAG